VRGEVQRLDPNLPIYDVQTMEQRVGAATARTRVTGLLLTVFAATALLLALIGIYGVVAYAVAQRTRELGLRIALGAARTHVAALVLRHGGVLVGLGLALGLLGAWSTTRVLRSLLFEVQPTDPVVFVALALVTMAVAFVASAIPALRATRVDPLVALKSE
jgi:putative ABC transport system permease protein